MARSLMVAGALLFAIGAVVWAAQRFLTTMGHPGMGHLPGDFLVRKGNFTIYLPLASSILLSLILSGLLWLLRR